MDRFGKSRNGCISLACGLAAIGSAIGFAQQTNSDKLITYSTDRKGVQYIVIDIAAQAGLGYKWQKSFNQTDPACRRYVENVSIKGLSFDKAMATILDPVTLRYQVEDNKVVLYRR